MKTRKHPKVWIKWGTEGERLTVAEAARRIGIMPGSLWHRLERGVCREKLLSPSWSLRPECARKTPPATATKRPMPVVPKRTLVEAKAVMEKVKQHGSPVRAALNGDLSGEEYLAAEAWRNLCAE